MEKIQEQQRYYFPCANDDAKPTCFICRQFFRSMKSLFDHLNAHSDSDWEDVLPRQPTTAVVNVRCTLLPNISGSSSLDDRYSSLTEGGLSFDEENDCKHDCEVVDMMKLLPESKATGRRGRKSLKDVKVVIVSGDGAGNMHQVGLTGESQTAARGGGRVVLDFDLNEYPPVMAMEDESLILSL